MIATSFRAMAQYLNNEWVVLSAAVGVKEAEAKAQQERINAIIQANNNKFEFIATIIITIFVVFLAFILSTF